ncbi:MAG TPA: DUF1624 domain-containing protein [Candidatus Butyricicoccus stercorigallinarum]|nr:DUF1624 domain-containing protein [Candidatus Butyricicoccus stercorigallinarum]
MDRQLNLTTQPPAASGRYLFLDRLRGLTLLSMIAYHTCWDAVNLFGADWGWFDTTAAYVWQQSICWSFLLLSGFCWQLGHRPLRRGLLVLAAGEAVSVVTRLATPDQPVYFGVLTLIGIGMLLLIPLDRLFRRVPAPLGLAVSALLFFALRNAKDGTFGFERWVIAPVPDAWYRNLLTAFLGFPPEGFYSADYFPPVPWLFLYFAGYFAFSIWKSRAKAAPQLSPHGALPALGRHTLPVYLLHQPLLFGIFSCLSMISGG